MKWLRTIRFRFVIWTATFLALVLLVLDAYLYLNLRIALYQTVDDELRLAAEAAANVTIEDGKLTADESILNSLYTASSRSRGISIRLIASDGAVLHSSAHTFESAPSSATTSAQPLFTTFYDPALQSDVRLFSEPIVFEGQRMAIVQAAQALNGVERVLGQLLFALALAIPLMTIFAATGSYLLVTRTLRPIDRMTYTARAISSGDLSARMNLSKTDDEVGRLAATFDDMLDRLEASFERERRFLADASHELRTPITAMQAILGVMREQRRTPEDYERAMDDLADVNARMRALVERLLQASRIESPVQMLKERVNLSDLLNDLGETMQPIAQQRGLALSTQCAPGLYVLGDIDALLRLFINLIDNALKYTDAGFVRVTAQARQGLVQVEVTDSGCGIAPEDLPHIFDRFYRADPSRSATGFGLGLTIVQDIARRHNGKMSVTSEVGRGTTFAIALPQAQAV